MKTRCYTDRGDIWKPPLGCICWLKAYTNKLASRWQAACYRGQSNLTRGSFLFFSFCLSIISYLCHASLEKVNVCLTDCGVGIRSQSGAVWRRENSAASAAATRAVADGCRRSGSRRGDASDTSGRYGSRRRLVKESCRRRSRRIEIHPAGRAQRVADHGRRRRSSRREILVMVREIVGRRGAATAAGRCRVTGRCRRGQGRQGLVSLKAVVMVVVVMSGRGQLGAVTLAVGRRRPCRTAVMVVMRLMLMGGMSEHGSRRMLTVMMMMMSGCNHRVTVRVLTAAAASVFSLVRRRRLPAGRAARVETQKLLDGERRSLRQRRGRHAGRNGPAGCG